MYVWIISILVAIIFSLISKKKSIIKNKAELIHKILLIEACVFMLAYYITDSDKYRIVWGILLFLACIFPFIKSFINKKALRITDKTHDVMTNKNTNKKNSLNNTIGNTVISIHWIILICLIIGNVIIWTKTNNLVYIISGILAILGVLINIHFLSKARD